MIKFRLPGYYSKDFDQVRHLTRPKLEYIKGYRWRWRSCRSYLGAQQSPFPKTQPSWTQDRHFVPITAHHRWLLHPCTAPPLPCFTPAQLLPLGTSLLLLPVCRSLSRLLSLSSHGSSYFQLISGVHPAAFQMPTQDFLLARWVVWKR